jgi:hypothetical protein
MAAKPGLGYKIWTAGVSKQAAAAAWGVADEEDDARARTFYGRRA